MTLQTVSRTECVVNCGPDGTMISASGVWCGVQVSWERVLSQVLLKAFCVTAVFMRLGETFSQQPKNNLVQCVLSGFSILPALLGSNLVGKLPLLSPCLLCVQGKGRWQRCSLQSLRHLVAESSNVLWHDVAWEREHISRVQPASWLYQPSDTCCLSSGSKPQREVNLAHCFVSNWSG